MAKKKTRKKGSRFLTFEAFAMAFALLCFLSFLCLVTGNLLIGGPGIMIRKFFMGAFGYLSFIVLLIGVFFALKAVIGFKVRNKFVKRVVKYSAIYSFFAVLLLQTALTSIHNVPFVEYIKLCYLSGAAFSSCTAGGVVFGVLAWALCNLLSPIGVYIFYSVVLCLTTVILLREQIFGSVKNSSRHSNKHNNEFLSKDSKNYSGRIQNQPFSQNGKSNQKNNTNTKFGGEFEFNNRDKKRNKKNHKNSESKNSMPFSSNGFSVNKSYSEQPSNNNRLDLSKAHSYQNDYDADLQSKIDYVRRPSAPQGITVNSPMGTTGSQSDYQGYGRGTAMDIDLSEVEQQTYVVNNGGRSRENIPAFDRRRTSGNSAFSSRDDFVTNNEDYENSRGEDLSREGRTPEFSRGGNRPFSERDNRSFLNGFEERASFEPSDMQQGSIFDKNTADEDVNVGRARYDNSFARRGGMDSTADTLANEQNERGDIANFRNNTATPNSENVPSDYKEEQISDFKNGDVLRRLSREGRENPTAINNYADKQAEDNPSSDTSKRHIHTYIPTREQEQIAPELKKYNPDESVENNSVSQSQQLNEGKNNTAGGEAGKKLTTESLPKDRQLINPIDNMPKNYRFHFPPLTLLKEYAPNPDEVRKNKEEQEKRKEIILQTLAQTNIEARIEDVKVGPALTRFEISIPPNVQIKKVIERQDDLNLWLAAKNKIRIVAPIPGTSRIGIEVPNANSSIVGLKSIISSRLYRDASMSELFFGFGKDTIGNTVITNIVDMPHLLVAGATGTGKSVFLNSLLISLMYKYSPEDLRIIIVDPKVVEFSVYMDLPHLMFNEILTDNRKTCAMLEWVVKEMDERYETFKDSKVKKIQEYNDLMIKTGGKKMPKILIIIDEFADIMSSSSERKLLENKLNRIAAKARAAGIHVILATQRPSADIVEGSIKTNFVSRIAFKMSSGTDAQVIMNEVGAEKLLGMGDALHRTGKMSTTERAQCAFVSNSEVEAVCDYIRGHNRCYYNEFALEEINKVVQEEEAPAVASAPAGGVVPPKNDDEIIKRAMRIAINERNVSGSMLQRKLGLGYPKAAKIMDILVSKGYIGALTDNRHREIIMTRESFEQTFGEPFDNE